MHDLEFGFTPGVHAALVCILYLMACFLLAPMPRYSTCLHALCSLLFWVLLWESNFHSTPPTGGVESTSWNSVCLFVCLSVFPSSLWRFQYKAFKSSQNHVRPHILYIIGKRRTSAMTSDDNDKDKRKDKDKDKDKMTKRPNICHIFENDMT